MATGPVDFWRRWHISLSSWFRDYVYIPLGGSRGGTLATSRNLLLTFLISGFWHGASWNYVIWGAYHGVLVVIARAAAGLGPSSAFARSALRPFQHIGMFILALVGWLFFRETDVSVLWRDLTLSPWTATAFDRQMGGYLFLSTAIYAVPLWIDDVWAVYVRPRLTQPAADADANASLLAARALLAGLGLAILLVFRSRQTLDFIYFQF
jgi:alginate O-acetyltransferase complex protein AlgI